MTRSVVIVACDRAKRADAEAWVEATPGAAWAWDDKLGEGDIVWVGADDRPPAVHQVPGLRVTEQIRVEPFAHRQVEGEGARFLRTLLIKVRPGTGPQQVAGLEAALLAMPDHIAAIGSWALSRLDPRATAAGWTHLWEQEFAEIAGFRPYMAHPFHWTGVERWFDPEIPGHIVTDEAHYLSPVPAAVL